MPINVGPQKSLFESDPKEERIGSEPKSSQSGTSQRNNTKSSLDAESQTQVTEETSPERTPKQESTKTSSEDSRKSVEVAPDFWASIGVETTLEPTPTESKQGQRSKTSTSSGEPSRSNTEQVDTQERGHQPSPETTPQRSSSSKSSRSLRCEVAGKKAPYYTQADKRWVLTIRLPREVTDEQLEELRGKTSVNIEY